VSQKLSKCEVKAWICWNLTTLPPLRFYVKSYFSTIMSFLAILEVLNFDFSTFEQLSRPKFTKIQSSESLKLPKWHFWTVWIHPKLITRKIWVAVKSSNFNKVKPYTVPDLPNKGSKLLAGPFWVWLPMVECLNFIFWKFLEHSALSNVTINTNRSRHRRRWRTISIFFTTPFLKWGIQSFLSQTWRMSTWIFAFGSTNRSLRHGPPSDWGLVTSVRVI